MDKVVTIIQKEWAEVFKNRLVLFSVAFLPLIFVALPLLTMVATDRMALPEGEALTEESIPNVETLCAGLSEVECARRYTLNIYNLLFMILPVAIPVTIAAYSVVGEKTTRSLEPLLATPITTVELLTGKALAAITPAVAVTWLSFSVYVGAMWILLGPATAQYLLAPMWLLAIFVVGPLLTLLAVGVAIIISSRVSDPRVAEQLSMLVLLPIILGVIGQSAGLILLDRRLVLLVALVVALLDVLLVWATLRAFQRETILTRWS